MKGDAAGTQYGRCRVCGANEWRVIRSSLPTRLWRWFNDGWRGYGANLVTCGQCGTGSLWRSFGPLSFRRPHPLGAPWRVYNVLRQARTEAPFPRTYALGAAAGTTLGLTLMVLGRSFRAVPVAAGLGVVATWVVFLSSVRSSGYLSTDLADAVSPGWGMRRRREQEERLLRNLPFPLYGLTEAFTGMRSFGGMGSRWTRGAPRHEQGVHKITLTHGDPRAEDGPLVRVATDREPPFPPELRFGHQAEGAGETVAIVVDGIPTVFHRWGDDASWTAEAEVDGVTVTIEARSFPVAGVDIGRVTNPEPYIEGARQLAATLSA